MSDRNGLMGRRAALKNMMLGLGAGLAAVGASHVAWAGSGMSSAPPDLLPAGAATLKELSKRLEKASRRRDFKARAYVGWLSVCEIIQKNFLY